MMATAVRTPERLERVGRDMEDLVRELFPICRSITGDGLRESLRRLDKVAPVEVTEVPSGTHAFDWVVPPEWNIRDAWIADETGRRIVDFRESNLHVVNYSSPVRRTLTLEELRPHLHTLPDRPDLVPYRTSYYDEQWGFCLADEQLQRIPDGVYEAVIDSTLRDGSLTYGECVLPGTTTDEVLISSHICHPSLANDNLSGVTVAIHLAAALADVPHRYTYRFVFAPGTIGAIVWLAAHEGQLDRIKAGLVLACVGDDGELVYKRSRRGDSEADVVAAHALRDRGEVVDFSPYGNDERQYCSPGINLPVGAITRSGFDRSPVHHTSADDLGALRRASLVETYVTCLDIVSMLERNRTCVNLAPKCEPQLGRRGLYRVFGGRADRGEIEAAITWVLSYSDGTQSLVEIAERAGLPFDAVDAAATALESAGLVAIQEVGG